MKIDLVRNFRDRLESVPRRIIRSFRVSRKGCGRGSGEAPRALKLLLLNRLSAGDPDSILHDGGDSYQLKIVKDAFPFTFRLTASQRLSETGRPWFNASATEISNWQREGRVLVIAECRRTRLIDTEHNPFLVRVYVIDPTLFADIAFYATKPSESTPTALFEVRKDDSGFYLFNLTAKDVYPIIRPTVVIDGIKLDTDESDLLTEAYATRWEQASTNGKFEPLVVTVDPGTAPAEEIADLLASLSTLYRLLGGSGVTFTMTDARFPAMALV